MLGLAADAGGGVRASSHGVCYGWLQVLEGVCERAHKYDCWRAHAHVYTSRQPEPQLSTSYYEALLDSVPAERVSVPVIMHALLEQVCKGTVDELVGGLCMCCMGRLVKEWRLRELVAGSMHF